MDTGVISRDRTANLIVQSRSGKFIKLEYVLDGEDAEYFRMLNASTEEFVITGCAQLLHRSISLKASVALMSLGVKIGVSALAGLGILLYARASSDQQDQTANEEFLRAFDALVDRALAEFGLIFTRAALA